jgi:uncharacterized protein
MRIAVTGATGFIGTALVAALRADGHTVQPVTRGASDDPHAVRWDPAGGSIDAAALDGVDAVVHLAGAGIGDKRWTAARKAEIRNSRVEGTGLLARTLAGLRRRPAVLCSASGVHYYGERGDDELTEADGPGEGFLSGVVQAWEAAAKPAIDAGIRTVFLRSGIVLANHGGVLPRMLLPFKAFVGGRLGSGRQWVSWITLADHVGAVRFLIGHDEVTGPVNMTAPAPVTNAELTLAIGRALHRPTLVPVPPFAPRLLLGRELVDELVLTSLRVRPERLTAAGYGFRHPDIDTALAAVLGREAA